MLYINQLDYPNMEYITRLELPGENIHTTIASSACGLCSACMIVDQLTTRVLTLEHARQISYDTKSNLRRGTSMKPFAPRVAEEFGLDYRATDSAEELAEHLRRGGKAIVHVRGTTDGKLGLFAKVGHYITVIGISGDEVCILDPSFKEGKYDEPERREKVRVSYPFLYASLSDLHEERSPAAAEGKYLHLFSRKGQNTNP